MVPSVQHGSSHGISMKFSPKQVGGKFGTMKIHDISTRLLVYPKKKKKTRRPYTCFFLTASSAKNPSKRKEKVFQPSIFRCFHSHGEFFRENKKLHLSPPKKKQSSKKPSNWYWSPSPRHASQSNRFQEEWNWAKPMPIPNLGRDHFTVDVGDEVYYPVM